LSLSSDFGCFRLHCTFLKMELFYGHNVLSVTEKNLPHFEYICAV